MVEMSRNPWKQVARMSWRRFETAGASIGQKSTLRSAFCHKTIIDPDATPKGRESEGGFSGIFGYVDDVGAR